jgi:uncharacterized membrane protein YfcA
MFEMDIVLKLIGVIVIAIGIVCVYDARKLVNKFFSTSDTNSAVRTMKIVGFVVAIIGGVLVIV